MEVAAAIGLTASIATLAKSAKLLLSLAQDVHHASKDIEELEEAVEDICLQTKLLERLLNDLPLMKTSMRPVDEKLVADVVSQAAIRIQRIVRDVERTLSKSDWKARFHIILDKSAGASNVLTKLSFIQQMLTFAMNTMSTYAREYDHQMIKAIDRRTALLVDTYEAALLLPKAANPLHPVGALSAPQQQEEILPQYYSSRTLGKGYLLWPVAVLTCQKKQHRTSYTINTRVMLPLSYVLNFDLMWRTDLFSNMRFSLARLVPGDCDLMQACERGDVLTMRNLLRTNQGHPSDTTTDNFTPLSYAVLSGNLEAVRTLVSFGADVNTPFSVRQHSALSWAIYSGHADMVRFLLQRGAWIDHIDTFGWSPLFFIWSVGSRAESYPDILDMLVSDHSFSLSHEEVINTDGYGVIAHAFLFGTAQGVESLLDAGVSPFTKHGPLEWTAMELAVYEGEMNLFERLLSHFSVDVRDSQGWTLLHISAFMGYSDISRRLLALGANPTAKTLPLYCHMDEKWLGGCTPAELTRAESNERWLDILKAIRDIAGPHYLAADELEALEEDDWFDAEEILDCS